MVDHHRWASSHHLLLRIEVLSLQYQVVSFVDLLSEVPLVFQQLVNVDYVLIQKHTRDLTRILLAKHLRNLRIYRISNEVLFVV